VEEGREAVNILALLNTKNGGGVGKKGKEASRQPKERTLRQEGDAKSSKEIKGQTIKRGNQRVLLCLLRNPVRRELLGEGT